MHHGAETRHANYVVWLAMLLAMGPLVLRTEVALIWQNNLPRWRGPATVTFIVGYLLPWLFLGLGWVNIAKAYTLTATEIALGGMAVCLWQCSPLRQRCLNLCHRAPRLRAFGSGVLTGAGAYGLRAGLICSAICGPAMLLAMSVSGYHLAMMVLVTCLLTFERYLPARRPTWRMPFAIVRREPHWRALALPLPPAAVSA